MAIDLNGGNTVTSTKCHIDTVISPDDGHIVAWNMYRKEINTLRKIVHEVGLIYKIFLNRQTFVMWIWQNWF